MMKNIYFILISLLMGACCLPDMCPPETTYTLVNNSSHAIIIKPFVRHRIPSSTNSDFSFNGDFEIAEVLFLKPNETKNFLRAHRDSRRFYSIQGVDSVRVIFDNKKILINTSQWDSLSQSGILDGLLRSYTFTEQDYQEAEDCGGKCE